MASKIGKTYFSYEYTKHIAVRKVFDGDVLSETWRIM